MGDYKEELLTVVRGWTLEQLDVYIGLLEMRQVDTHAIIKELRIIRRKKVGRKTPDNGMRGGK
jgi:hypothetical protein